MSRKYEETAHNVAEISLQAKFPQETPKSANFPKIRVHYFFTVLYACAFAQEGLRLSSKLKFGCFFLGVTFKMLSNYAQDKIHAVAQMICLFTSTLRNVRPSSPRKTAFSFGLDLYKKAILTFLRIMMNTILSGLTISTMLTWATNTSR